MPNPFAVLLWIRSLSLAGGLGPPYAVLLAELELYGAEYRPAARA